MASLTLLNGCSDQNEALSDNSTNAKVSTFLRKFYSENFHLGKKVETIIAASPSASMLRTKEFDNVIITEVFVGNDVRARGYVITDKVSNDFLYFLDVDRTDFKLTSISIDVNETIVFNDINELDKYLATDELDYIKIAEDFANGNTTIEANRFWGWGQGHPSGICVNGRDYWVREYYVCWFGVSQGPVPGEGGNLWSPCGEYVNP